MSYTLPQSRDLQHPHSRERYKLELSPHRQSLVERERIYSRGERPLTFFPMRLNAAFPSTPSPRSKLPTPSSSLVSNSAIEETEIRLRSSRSSRRRSPSRRTSLAV